jgi:hypothetical protein
MIIFGGLVSEDVNISDHNSWNAENINENGM